MNNDQAFLDIIFCFRGDLLRFAAHRVLNYSDAEDIVQATILNAWKKRNDLIAAEYPQSYLYTILKRQIYRYRQMACSGPILYGDINESLIGIESDVLSLLIKKENSIAVYDAVNHLAPAYSQIMHICLIDQASVHGAAEALGINYNTARWRKHHAILELRAALINSGITPNVRRHTKPANIFERLRFWAKGFLCKKKIWTKLVQFLSAK